jgi:ABC-type polysaccharide/polyol phosphate transport system ATPase subunit
MTSELRDACRLMLNNVSVEYRLLSPLDYNLKRRVVNYFRRNRDEQRIVKALDNVSLFLNDGDRLGILGLNGAGKTTLLHVLAGVLPPSKGEYYLKGRSLGLLGGAELGLDQEASGRQNIVSIGIALGEDVEYMHSLVDDIIEFSGIGTRIDDPVYTYSSGMSARLRFSTLTALRPHVLVIDEGIGAADSEFAAKAEKRLSSFMDSAGIMIMASHNAGMLRDFCNRGLVIHEGKILSDSGIEEAIATYQKLIKSRNKTK